MYFFLSVFLSFYFFLCLSMSFYFFLFLSMSFYFFLFLSFFLSLFPSFFCCCMFLLLSFLSLPFLLVLFCFVASYLLQHIYTTSATVYFRKNLRTGSTPRSILFRCTPLHPVAAPATSSLNVTCGRELHHPLDLLSYHENVSQSLHAQNLISSFPSSTLPTSTFTDVTGYSILQSVP